MNFLSKQKRECILTDYMIKIERKSKHKLFSYIPVKRPQVLRSQN
uniref:Uncharacterized protein n=1 Tax=Arundo donax TaxID=35708 RepID=A0A0A9C0Z3_ARUDO